ncbi:MAG TPA: hypothetical protein VGX23_00315 [Actinocrinis sp.]|nr:hypothetical protein [Actinocrinis sp.]
MRPRDFADDLDHLTGLLTNDGWEQLDLGLAGPQMPELLTGIGFRLMISPDRRALLTANWRATHASTELQSLDPHDPDATPWRAHADNLPVHVLIAAAHAATAHLPGSGPFRLLREAGWTKQPPRGTGPGSYATVLSDPAAARSATATYLSAPGYTARGPWLIARGGARAFAHTTPTAPGPVITALALTDPTA